MIRSRTFFYCLEPSTQTCIFHCQVIELIIRANDTFLERLKKRKKGFLKANTYRIIPILSSMAIINQPQS